MAIAYNNAAGAPILMIGGNDANFHDRVTRSLDKIGQTIAGAALLAGIQTNRVNGSNVGIVTGLGTFSCGTQCMHDATGLSRASKNTSFTHVICPKNKPFFTETLKAEEQWRSHQTSYRRSRCFCPALACMFANYLCDLVGQFAGI